MAKILENGNLRQLEYKGKLAGYRQTVGTTNSFPGLFTRKSLGADNRELGPAIMLPEDY